MPGKGVGHKIIVKPLGAGQSFTAMIGYITKDQGQPHFQIKTVNVSAQVYCIICCHLFRLY